MLDARKIYRKVSRRIYDFAPEQQKNVAAIVWLYRGQSDRFLKLVESYLAQAVAEGQATGEPLATFKDALGNLTDLTKPFAAGKRHPDPLAGDMGGAHLRTGRVIGPHSSVSGRSCGAGRPLEPGWEQRGAGQCRPACSPVKACTTRPKAAGTDQTDRSGSEAGWPGDRHRGEGT